MNLTEEKWKENMMRGREKGGKEENKEEKMRKSEIK